MNAEILQLALPDFSETDRRCIPEKKEKGERYLPLSLSRLELAAWHLDYPNQPVKDPRVMTTDQHLNILSGLAIHQIVQATSLWNRALPLRWSSNCREDYQKNLSDLIDLIPTSQAPSVRLTLSMLADERLAMRKDDVNLIAKRKNYEIITDKVISWMRSVEPFTNTPAFPQFREDPRLAGEIPFPDPAAINRAWDEQQQSALIHQRVDNLFKYHESKAALPTDFARHGDGHYFSELRLYAVLHKLNAVWSMRLDQVTIGSSPQIPTKQITVIDYKLNEPFMPPEGSFRRLALRLSTWLTAQSLLALSDGFEPTGRSIKVNIPRPIINLDTKIDLVHLGLATDPASELNLSHNWSSDWTFEGPCWGANQKLGAFVDHIRNNQALAPIFS